MPDNVVELKTKADIPKQKLPPAQSSLVNLVSKIPEDKQKEIAKEVIDNYKDDNDSRQAWKDNRDRWYRLWACIREEKDVPWVDCSNVCIPLLATAANQFHARAYQAIFAPPGIVKAIPVGPNDVRRAQNVEKYLNWQILTEMEEYEEIFDRTLLQLPINGICFKKLYQSAEEDRVVSEYISAVNLVLPYRTKNLKSTRRLTQELWLHYDELMDRNEAGLYENFDDVNKVAGERDDSPTRETEDEVTGIEPKKHGDEPHLVLECHRKYDLGDGRNPYIITVDRDSETLLRMTSREFTSGSEKLVLDYYTDYHFIPNPEGFYSLGFGHFLEPLNEMANTAFNQIFDAGSLSNMPFGFYGRRAGFKADKIALSPGKMIPVEDANQVLFPKLQRLDSVLFQVLGLVQQYVEQFTSVSDPILGRQTKGVERPTAAGTIATIEQGLITFTVMTKRIFRSLKKELRTLMTLNQLFLDDVKEYRVVESVDKIAFPDVKKEDFEGVFDVIPIGDPSFASRMTKRLEARELYELLINNPLVIGTPPDKETGQSLMQPNPRIIWEITNDLIETYEKANKSKLLPEQPEESLPPEQENSMFVQGDYKSPIPGENHVLHTGIHTAFIRTEFYEEMPEEYKELLERHLQETQFIAMAEIQRQQQVSEQQRQVTGAQAFG